MNDFSPSQMETLRKISSFILYEWNTGKTQEEIILMLVEKQIDRKLAETLVIEVIKASKDVNKNHELYQPQKGLSGNYVSNKTGFFNGKTLFGIILLLIGTIATLKSYIDAREVRYGVYTIYFGLIIVGILNIVRGIISWSLEE